eukprot:CAMPEP_0174246042 /NCGR_PEP_ID=MMETSP0417-20130205/41871_1 /TAXON_ID=242541 /ORGANISM="Mayorella sp, Strain BSH-02190019" /LENGTH=421 /DNA_ID=CAMNT_0015325893 /DNA_START=87 /DNA_END=1349 /DNA_ORIENTATION=-
MHTLNQQEALVLLGVDDTASLAEIRTAYKRLALCWHPDKCSHPEATQRFQRIAHAYQVLVSIEEEVESVSSIIPTEQAARDLFFSVFGPLFKFELATRTHRCVEHTLSCRSPASTGLYTSCDCRPALTACVCASPASLHSVRRPRCLSCASAVQVFWPDGTADDLDDLSDPHAADAYCYGGEPTDQMECGEPCCDNDSAVAITISATMTGHSHQQQQQSPHQQPHLDDLSDPHAADAYCYGGEPTDQMECGEPCCDNDSAVAITISATMTGHSHQQQQQSPHQQPPHQQPPHQPIGIDSVYRCAATTLGSEHQYSRSAPESGGSFRCVWPSAPSAASYLGSRRGRARARSVSRLSSAVGVVGAETSCSSPELEAGTASADPSAAACASQPTSIPSDADQGNDDTPVFPGSHAPGCGRGILW